MPITAQPRRANPRATLPVPVPTSTTRWPPDADAVVGQAVEHAVREAGPMATVVIRGPSEVDSHRLKHASWRREALQRIYAPFALATPISFEVEPPDVAEMARRVRHTLPFAPRSGRRGRGPARWIRLRGQAL